jgi:hypothetical protein
MIHTESMAMIHHPYDNIPGQQLSPNNKMLVDLTGHHHSVTKKHIHLKKSH